ncbi:hypothetical protein KFL_001640160 [Klebsormidium nitens]|uniref:Uncharacterized protein n=1 Tax=Klebsormidium nitens TaxID=105231 RepID=A0A0U9HV42_KLENI|nr:hypothetical protein KFL_001640160 [Klebsormidium nitens]|eukprot:GAQ83841.1 hypothetical protein KFL_001640160 [Klebsormidium nitens]
MASSLASCRAFGGALQVAPIRYGMQCKASTSSSQERLFRPQLTQRSVVLGMRLPLVPQGRSKVRMTATSPNEAISGDLPSEAVIEDATRFGVSFPKTLFEFSGKPGWGKRGDPWQHHFGLPTAPGANNSATYPQYDVTLNNITFHKSFGHLFATLNFLIPTVMFWNDPTRQPIVLLLAFCTAQTAFEHIFHIVTNQIHFVHLWKQIPILGAGALALYYGAWDAAQSGPRDLLFYEWWYFLTVFVGGTIFEGFVTHFGKFWPVKAPGSE